jgi:ATP-dependent exoDNAse (exonuclease V) beta subunit
MYQAIALDVNLSRNFSNGSYKIGELEEVTNESNLSGVVSLNGYHTHEWRDKLVIRESAKEFFGLEDKSKRHKINYGIHMHTVLSRITYLQDLERSIESMISEGIISIHEKDTLRVELEKLFSDPQIAEWFSEKWKVRTEVPILIPNQSESRIDRLITPPRDAVVIDYKTGKFQKSDQHQVEEYMEILKEMNYKYVEGFLLYLDDHRIVRVKEGRTRVVKKKDENQLDLGL